MRRPDPSPSARALPLKLPLPALVALIAVTLGGPAAASTRIAIAPVKGDAGGALRAQLSSALCVENRCVPGAVDGSRARLERARRRGVQAAVLASVVRARGRRELAGSLVTTTRRSLGSWRVPLGRGRLVPRDRLERLAGDIDAALPARRRPPPEPPPTFEPPPPQEPAAVDRSPALAAAPAAPADAPWGEPRTSWRSAPEAEAEPDPTPPEAVDEPVVTETVFVPRSRPELSEPPRWRPEAAPPDRPGGDRDALLAGDVGIEAARRALAFPSGGKAPVGYVVSVAAPSVRLEAYPLRSVGGLAAGLGGFAEGAYLPATALGASSQKFRVAFAHLRAGALSRLRFFDGGLVLRPAVAWEVEWLALRAANGALVPGVLDVTLAGPSLGVDLAVPLWRNRLSALGGARGIWWLRARELAGNARFFPEGRALGIDLEAGAGLRLFGTLSARVLGYYEATQWWLQPAAGGPYTVHSARAAGLGLRTWIRLEL